MDMLKEGFISKEIIEAHAIPLDLLKNCKWKEIVEYLSTQIKLDEIILKGCTENELQIARNVGTNLTPLKKEQTKALIKHARAITELQVKLYLPHILLNK